jgi:hypothetical protein
MERDHLPITLPVIEKMRLAAIDNVLDVGCGSGLVKKAEEYQFSGPFVRDWDEGEPPEKAWAPPRDRKLHGDEKKELA